MSQYEWAHHVAVVGVEERIVTRRRHPMANAKGIVTVTSRIEKCVPWCECGWRGQVTESRPRAFRAYNSHECP